MSTASTRPSRADVEAQITAARDWLSDSPTRYQHQRYSAVVAALTWALRGGPGPVSGDDYPTIDDQALFTESHAAHAAEQTALALGGDSTTPGCVHETLEWLLGRGEEPVD